MGLPLVIEIFSTTSTERQQQEKTVGLRNLTFFSDEGTVIVGRSADTEQSPPLRPTAAALQDVSIASTGAQ